MGIMFWINGLRLGLGLRLGFGLGLVVFLDFRKSGLGFEVLNNCFSL